MMMSYSDAYINNLHILYIGNFLWKRKKTKAGEYADDVFDSIVPSRYPNVHANIIKTK